MQDQRVVLRDYPCMVIRIPREFATVGIMEKASGPFRVRSP